MEIVDQSETLSSSSAEIIRTETENRLRTDDLGCQPSVWVWGGGAGINSGTPSTSEILYDVVYCICIS